jgi:hypothetical protein
VLADPLIKWLVRRFNLIEDVLKVRLVRITVDAQLQVRLVRLAVKEVLELLFLSPFPKIVTL